MNFHTQLKLYFTRILYKIIMRLFSDKPTTGSVKLTPKCSRTLNRVIARPSDFSGEANRDSELFSNFSSMSAFSLSVKARRNISTSEVNEDKWLNLRKQEKDFMKMRWWWLVMKNNSLLERWISTKTNRCKFVK